MTSVLQNHHSRTPEPNTTHTDMGSACYQHFSVICCLVWAIGSFYSAVESYPSPLTDCDDYGDYIQGSALLSSLCGVEWRNQDQEQIQNVFKRFLFHYSKAHNSVGSVERESHSVHPLMRLSPKLSLRRKKQLKNVCGTPGRKIRDVLCSYLGFSLTP
ncbi:neuromedin-S isoform X2 [Ctenopharyngodon idella]|uniref:neuromedin-S isoform X2 n=1 Tax=Ctenopharyngodon idella TaxID=7959 RepID=UPI0022314F0B|nr:neuromedin-S isoform X2 [Ctenopharyngodon idella]